MSVYTSRSAHYCGVNVPAETGKMSRSDKRGATLPKVATTRYSAINANAFETIVSQLLHNCNRLMNTFVK